MTQNPTQASHAIIHVGTEKTGTTSLQNVLGNNREWLREQGILYPKSGGKLNHTRLVAAAEDHGVIDNIKAHLMASRRESEDELRRSFRNDLAREVGAGAPWHTLVLSSELIHSRLHSSTEIDRLMSFLPDSIDQVTILAVLRRQDQLAISRFSTAIRAGHTGFDDVFADIAEHAYRRLPPGRDVSDFTQYYNYLNLIDRFARHVPEANIHLRLYGIDGKRTDPIEILSDVLKLDLGDLSQDSPTLNKAMSAEAQFTIARINQCVPSHLPSGKRDSSVVALKRRIEAELDGPPRQTTRAEAEAFLARFESSNEALRVRFFPERKTLFDDDFSMYPEIADYSGFPDQMEPIIEDYLTSFVEASSNATGFKGALNKVRKLWTS